jgi:hypothetical protein
MSERKQNESLKRGDRVKFSVGHRRGMKTVTGTVNGVRGEVVTVRAGWLMYVVLRSDCQRVSGLSISTSTLGAE